MALPDPADVIGRLEQELSDFADGYIAAFDLVYRPRQEGLSQGRSSGASDKTGETATSSTWQKAQIRRSARRARKALAILSEANAMLGELFHEDTEGSDPPPLGPDDRIPTRKELQRLGASRDKRRRGETTVLPSDRYGVV